MSHRERKLAALREAQWSQRLPAVLSELSRAHLFMVHPAYPDEAFFAHAAVEHSGSEGGITGHRHTHKLEPHVHLLFYPDACSESITLTLTHESLHLTFQRLIFEHFDPDVVAANFFIDATHTPETEWRHDLLEGRPDTSAQDYRRRESARRRLEHVWGWDP